MDNGFFVYLDRLTLLVFFSGYPFLYALVSLLAGHQRSPLFLKNKRVSLLPYAYALVGLLYAGYQLKNLYPDYSPGNLKQLADHYLKVWALLSLVFWIPGIPQKKILSLLHSFVFFFLLIKDLFSSTGDKESIRNDMKLYSISLLLNSLAFLFILLSSYLFSRYRQRRNTSGLSA